MKHLFILTISLLMAGMAMAQNQPDAEYNLIRRSYTVNADGSMDINFRKELKLLRNRAITAYADKGETFITYNPEFETLTINECYTIMADGTKVNTPENAFVYQLPSECTDCGRFNGIRELAIVHTALEYNCVIVLDYTIHRNSGFFVEHFSYQQDCPVKRFEYRPAYSTSTEVKTNIEQSVNDAYMPGNDAYEVAFQIGTEPTYTAEQTLPAAAKLLASLKKADSKEYIAAIRDWVVDYVHLNTVDLSHVNYVMAPAAEVFNSNCGTLLDKTGLLAALLNEAGFRATLANNYLSVFGDHPMEVEVSIEGKIYRLTADKKDAIMTESEKNDARAVANAPIIIDRELEWNPQPISDGYVRITLPTEKGALNINPALLAPSRNSNVQARITSEFYHYAIDLPKNAKLIGGDVEISYNYYDLGSINIIIKQKGRRLLITRNLQLRKAFITKTDYQPFRQLMNDWYSHRELIFSL